MKTKGSGIAANLGLRASPNGARAFACVLPLQYVARAELSIGLGLALTSRREAQRSPKAPAARFRTVGEEK